MKEDERKKDDQKAVYFILIFNGFKTNLRILKFYMQDFLQKIVIKENLNQGNLLSRKNVIKEKCY